MKHRVLLQMILTRDGWGRVKAEVMLKAGEKVETHRHFASLDRLCEEVN